MDAPPTFSCFLVTTSGFFLAQLTGTDQIPPKHCKIFVNVGVLRVIEISVDKCSPRRIACFPWSVDICSYMAIMSFWLYNKLHENKSNFYLNEWFSLQVRIDVIAVSIRPSSCRGSYKKKRFVDLWYCINKRLNWCNSNVNRPSSCYAPYQKKKIYWPMILHKQACTSIHIDMNSSK